MPRVRFNGNLGSRHAKDLDLDHLECTAGSVVEVDGDTLAALKKIGDALVSETAERVQAAPVKAATVSEPEKPADTVESKKK